ncbi:MAG: sulfite exporter TauE/SafE family protein [Bacteroidetes bacterium]|nr:sulfite exporter TauE/SafE family protein [Bacteroidota bacterium]
MEIVYLVLISFAASWLTFFSGFGLGTILTPVFYFLFNDLALAIAGTAIVHFLNNLFKFLLMQKSIDWKIAIPFGLASIPAAYLGAWLLIHFEDVKLVEYVLGTTTYTVQLMNLIFGLLLIVFAIVEMIPDFTLNIERRFLWVGGLISGFFGGLSGHQGALRTAFLTKYKLDKEVFIATGIVIALAVDISRSVNYFSGFDLVVLRENWTTLLASLLAAFVGAITGKYLLKKIDLKFLTMLIAISMMIFGIALAGGFLTR